MVIKRIKNDKFGRARWVCLCNSGKFITVLHKNLIKNKTKKYNYLSDNKKNKDFQRLYRILGQMKNRCNNKKSKDYKSYGARGIKICNEWLNNFMLFYNWSINNGYKENLTIDRIDVNGNYEPNNCRWVDLETQANNKRNNKLITYNGKTQTLSQWAKELKIKYSTLNNRINTNKWDIEKAFTQPLRKGGKYIDF